MINSWRSLLHDKLLKIEKQNIGFDSFYRLFKPYIWYDRKGFKSTNNFLGVDYD